MTIIKPSKDKSNVVFIILALCALLIGGGVYIYEYNSLVESRDTIERIEERVVLAEVENAEQKEAVYTLSDPTRLESFAKEHNLVLERKPEFLKF